MVFKLLVKQTDATLSHATSSEAAFMTRERVNDGVLFTINLEELSKTTGNTSGNLEGLELSLPANQFELLPRALSPDHKAGVPLQIWSETRVRGDVNEEFNIAMSERSTLWIPIENSRPVYKQPEIKKLDEGFFSAEQFSPGQTLINLPDLFVDVDPSETFRWEMVAPKALKGSIELDNSTGQIKLNRNINNLDDLPAGSHRLIVRAKDTSGSLGDTSGIASGSVRLFVASSEESPATIKGLSLLTQLAANDINDLYSKDADERTESEEQVITILDTMNVEETERAGFLKKLEQGSLAVLASPTADKPMILIDASRNAGALLMDAAVEDTETEILEASKKLLNDRDILDTPLGEIEFAVDTQGRDYSIVQLQMEEGGVTMDTLFKTDAEGNPLVFQSKILSYSTEDGPIEKWLSTLNYGIYDYSSGARLADSPVISINSSESSLAGSLLNNKPLFDLNQMEKIDGSAFLIDLDQNQTIDLVSMLLVDQGWFDTRKDIIGLIGDPLIPATTQSRKEIAGGGQGGQTSNTGQGNEQNKANSIPTETTDGGDSIPTNQRNSDETSSKQNNSTEEQWVKTQNENSNPIRPPQIDINARFNPSTNIYPIEQNLPNSPRTKNNEEDFREEGKLNGNQQDEGGGGIGNTKENSRRKDMNIDSGMLNPDSASSNGNGTSNILDDLQTWANKGRKNASEIFKSIISPLQQPSETSIAASLGMILLPLLTERSLKQGLKTIDQDLNLRILRRDQNFNGQWVGQSQNGQAIVIRREQGLLTVEKATNHLPISRLTKLPGFDSKGRSLLSKATTLCQQPGKLIRELLKARAHLLRSTDPEISWEAWLQDHFEETNTAVTLNNEI